MIHKEDTISVDNSTAANHCFISMNDYLHAVLIGGTEQKEDTDITLRPVHLSQLAFLHTSFHMYGFNYSRGALSVAFYYTVGAENVAPPSAGTMNVCKIIKSI